MGNPFLGLDAATLAQLKTAFTDALLAVAKNQAYSLNGRSLTRANLSEIKNTLGQIISAQQFADGTTTDSTSSASPAYEHARQSSAIMASLPWYERAIAAVAPVYANQRLTARVQRELFAYQGARTDRLYAPKTNAVPSESYQTARDRVVMMFEALDLVENFPPAKAAVSKFATFLTPTEYAPATGDRAYDAVVSEYFHAWCKTCDVTGRHSFRKLMQLLAEMRPCYGDAGVVMRRTTDGLRLQVIAGDRIGNPSEASGQFPNYLSGVVVDDFGRPTAYRIFRVTQAGQYIDPEDVAAEQFCHYFDPFRADQYRGVTDFHAVLRTSRMLKEILDAEMVGVRFASQQAALVFNERGAPQPRNLFSPGSTPPMSTGQQPQQEESQIGTIKYLMHGDKVETMPARPSSAFTGFVDELMGEIALGLGGYPAGVLWGTADYKGPSVRAEFAQADRVNQHHQGLLDDKVLAPIARAVILDAIALGEMPPPPRIAGESTEKAIVRATRGSFRFPPRLTIDVGRETQARLAELSMGILSPQEIAAEDGMDAYVRATQKADFAVFAAELAASKGVPESAIFLPAGQQLPNTPAQAAAVGAQTGDDAAKAQADSAPSAAPKEFSGKPRRNVAELLAGPRARKNKSLLSVAKRHERIASLMKAAAGGANKSAETTQTPMTMKGEVIKIEDALQNTKHLAVGLKSLDERCMELISRRNKIIK